MIDNESNEYSLSNSFNLSQSSDEQIHNKYKNSIVNQINDPNNPNNNKNIPNRSTHPSSKPFNHQNHDANLNSLIPSSKLN